MKNNNNINKTKMRVEVGENREMILKEVYNGITLVSNSGEKLSICMRDTGFEIVYDNKKYEAKKGIVEKIGCDIFCGMSYCDDNGCLERKRNNTEPDSENVSCINSEPQ